MGIVYEDKLNFLSILEMLDQNRWEFLLTYIYVKNNNEVIKA